MRPFESTKAYDLAAALPLILLYGWAVVTDAPMLRGRIEASLAEGAGPAEAIDAIALSLSILFAGLIILLILVRTVPVRKSDGLAPRLVAVAGAAGGSIMLLLPAAELPFALDAVSVALVLVGMSGAMVSLAWLKRSFSIFPEARLLVTGGPYALVRHPVYLFEEIAFLGVMLQYAQPWALFVFAAQLGFQFARIPHEERVLREAFPEYAGYAARTWRLLPGVY
jgi:protein-S-isoprenylcysteine O-methyltransferase Ste14